MYLKTVANVEAAIYGPETTKVLGLTFKWLVITITRILVCIAM
jgi:hypothetical protein